MTNATYPQSDPGDEQPALFPVAPDPPKCTRGCTRKNLCQWAADREHGIDNGNQPRTCLLRYDPANGPIPADHVLHHVCRVPRCVNPDHLQPLTSRAHRLLHASERTHCSKGHEMTPENTKFVNEGTQRQCRTCNAAVRKAANERYIASGKTRCIDCGTAIYHGFARCQRCSALEREARPSVRAQRRQPRPYRKKAAACSVRLGLR